MSTKANTVAGVSPELQDEIVEMLPVFVRTLNLIKMAGDTMSEQTVASLMTKLEKAANLLEVVDDERLPRLLNTLVEKGDVLVSLLDKITVLEQNGTLDKLLELSQALGTVTDALTEHSVKHITDTALPLVELGDQLLASPAVKNAPKLLQAVEKTVQEMEGKKAQQLSLLGLLGLLKKKEVQEAVQFSVALLGNLSQDNGR